MRSLASGGSSRRRPGWILPILAALAAGSALAFSERIEYRCVAQFQITGKPTTKQEVFYRKELLDFAWHRPTNESQPQATGRLWFVDSTEPGVLQLCLTTTDRLMGLDSMNTLANGYVNYIESLRKKALTTPSDGEKILSEYITALQQRLINVREQMDTLIAKLPENDPSRHRDTLRKKWQSLYKHVIQTRERLAQAIQELHGLRSEPEPIPGVVSPQERNQALEADKALQQDLAELAVNLTELKRHLLKVGQQSSAPLEKLSGALVALHNLVKSTQTSTRSEDIRRQLEMLGEQTKQYQDQLVPFVQAWTNAFAVLRRTEVDAYRDELLSMYHRTRSKLNDFLYKAAKHLSNMRTLVTVIGENQSDNARYYVLQSELVRTFQTLQTAHYRFEFVASRVETPGNFRLDAALKSARGLYRRSQHQIGLIDQRLQAAARKRARDRHVARVDAAGRLVDDIRATADQSIGQIISLQSDLNLSTEETETFQSALIEMKLADERLRALQTHVGEMNRKLQKLEDLNIFSADASLIRLLHCEATRHPKTLLKQLRVGGIGAVLTLATVWLGQWWINRRH